MKKKRELSLEQSMEIYDSMCKVSDEVNKMERGMNSLLMSEAVLVPTQDELKTLRASHEVLKQLNIVLRTRVRGYRKSIISDATGGK